VVSFIHKVASALADEFRCVKICSLTSRLLRDPALLRLDPLPHVPEIIGTPHQVVVYEIRAAHALVHGSRPDVLYEVRIHTVVRNTINVVIPSLASARAPGLRKPMVVGVVQVRRSPYSGGLKPGIKVGHRRPGRGDNRVGVRAEGHATKSEPGLIAAQDCRLAHFVECVGVLPGPIVGLSSVGAEAEHPPQAGNPLQLCACTRIFSIESRQVLSTNATVPGQEWITSARNSLGKSEG